MIDLHIHSSASDGSFSPSGLVRLAREKGIRLIALTDHDTISGVAEFLESVARTPGIEGVGGIEISAVGHGGGAGAHVHVLGYGVPARISPEFSRRLEDFRAARDLRGGAIVKNLQQLGVSITLEEAMAESGGEVFGRPHIAAVLIRKGVVRDTKEAFREYLATGARAYVERDRPTAAEAVRALRQERFVPVLAHPPIMQLPKEKLDAFVRELRDAGLMGLETYYPGYSRDDVGLCQTLAARYGLLRTGGSDFHGASKPEIALGEGDGSLHVPYTLGDRLREAITALAGQ